MTLKDLNTLLKAYDSDLRAVESLPYFEADTSRAYVDGLLFVPNYMIRMERKLLDHVRVIIDPPNPLQDPSDRQAALERHILVFNVWPNQMDNRIFYNLWATDSHKATADRQMQAIVDRIQRTRARAKDEFGFMVEAEGREMYRYANAVRTLPQGYHPRPNEPCYGGMSICD